ncbi:sensor histidine kinase [Muricoccus radiodurans]|uniref:sensor histidine kinase n=1 Tax=Muricoccus radiodurans TaxID=2231721 RepID=UPI003CF11F30
MQQDDAGAPDPGASVPEEAATLEAENAGLRSRLAEAERLTAVLRSELQHRVRNVLAVIRSVARRTGETSETAEDYVMHFDGRLDAIGRAQSMMMGDLSASVSLDQLLADELLAHAAREGDRLTLSGPPVRLALKAAEMLRLAVHELTVNAVKFGALSDSHGQIQVEWEVEPAPDRPGGGMLRLVWEESNGPAPAPAPRRRGFGTEMIERTLAYELGAEASLETRPDGQRCVIRVPFGERVALGGPGG